MQFGIWSNVFEFPCWRRIQWMTRRPKKIGDLGFWNFFFAVFDLEKALASKNTSFTKPLYLVKFWFGFEFREFRWNFAELMSFVKSGIFRSRVVFSVKSLWQFLVFDVTISSIVSPWLHLNYNLFELARTALADSSAKTSLKTILTQMLDNGETLRC